MVPLPVRPQMPQRTSDRGRQRGQIGPASPIAATRRRSPQFAQVAQLRGSRHQQGWQMAWPLSLRRAGGRIWPQRPQSMATALRVQPAQRRTPSNGRPSNRRRPQRGQHGITTVVAPARMRASTNRRTPGATAQAACPVSNSGRSATSSAMRRCPDGSAAASRRAAITVSVPSAGSSFVSSASSGPACCARSVRSIFLVTGSPGDPGTLRPQSAQALCRSCPHRFPRPYPGTGRGGDRLDEVIH